MRTHAFFAPILALTACAHEGHVIASPSAGETNQPEDDYRSRLDQWLRLEGDSSKPVTDQEILEHATQPLLDTQSFRRVNLGQHNGTSVRADYPCSDDCPTHTVRIVYYAVSDERCEAVGGQLRNYVVPYGISKREVSFCFPAIVLANWQAYLERSNLFMRASGAAAQ